MLLWQDAVRSGDKAQIIIALHFAKLEVEEISKHTYGYLSQTSGTTHPMFALHRLQHRDEMA